MYCFFFFSSRRRHTRCSRDWSSDVCSSDLVNYLQAENSGTGAALGIIAAGTDTDISINMQPKGAGLLQANGVKVLTANTGVDLSTNQSIGGTKTFTGEIIVPTPTNSTDAATKSYVDNIAQGLSPK